MRELIMVERQSKHSAKLNLNPAGLWRTLLVCRAGPCWSARSFLPGAGYRDRLADLTPAAASSSGALPGSLAELAGLPRG